MACGLQETNYDLLLPRLALSEKKLADLAFHLRLS